MKKKLVRFLYKLKWYRLAHKISPSLYYQCINEEIEDYIENIIDELTAIVSMFSQQKDEK